MSYKLTQERDDDAQRVVGSSTYRLQRVALHKHDIQQERMARYLEAGEGSGNRLHPFRPLSSWSSASASRCPCSPKRARVALNGVDCLRGAASGPKTGDLRFGRYVSIGVGGRKKAEGAGQSLWLQGGHLRLKPGELGDLRHPRPLGGPRHIGQDSNPAGDVRHLLGSHPLIQALGLARPRDIENGGEVAAAHEAFRVAGL